MAQTGQVFKGMISNLASKKNEAERSRTPREIEETFNRLMVCNTMSIHSRLESAIKSRAYLLVEVKRTQNQRALIRRLIFVACRRLDIALSSHRSVPDMWRLVDDGDFGLFAVLNDGADNVKVTPLCSSKDQIGPMIKAINREG